MAVEREVQLDDVDTELAWELLTRPEDLEAWLGAKVVLSATAGAPGRVVDPAGTVRRLVGAEVAEAHRLVWRGWTEGPGGDGAAGAAGWDASRVEITLTPTEGGTAFRVTETSLASTVTASGGASERWAGRLFDLQVLGLVATILIRA